MLNEYPPLVKRVLETATDELSMEELVQSLYEMRAWMVANEATSNARYNDMADYQAQTRSGIPMF